MFLSKGVRTGPLQMPEKRSQMLRAVQVYLHTLYPINSNYNAPSVNDFSDWILTFIFLIRRPENI